MDSYIQNASDVRKDWGRFIDNTVRMKPQFVKRSRDEIVALGMDVLRDVLSAYPLTAKAYKEEDGTMTASLDQIDLVTNGSDLEAALDSLAADLIEYAEEYYREFAYWSGAPNRKGHVPYILRVLSQKNAKEVRGLIQCQLGKN